MQCKCKAVVKVNTPGPAKVIPNNLKVIVQGDGAINLIELNGVPQEIVNKTVNLEIDRTTVGLSNVDDTSDLNKPISTATQEALDTKLNSANADLNMTKDISIQTNGDNVYLDVQYKNLATNLESDLQKQITLASDTQAGLMSMSDYAQIRENTAQIEQLKGQNVRLLYTASGTPTADEIRQFVIDSGYTDTTQWIYIGVVVQGSNHIWRYFDNTQAWEDIGLDTVNQFTNEIAGIIKGSEVDGKVYAETDGTGSVQGWGALKSSITDLQNNKANESDLDNYASKTKDNTYIGSQTYNNTNIHTANIRTSQSIYLTNLGGSVKDTVSKLYFGLPSDPKAYISANINGAFAILNIAGNGVTCYPESNFFPLGTELDLGRSANKWKNLYLSGNLNDGTNAISIANIVNKQNKPTYINLTITSEDWIDLANSEPYTKQALLTISPSIGTNTVVELINDNPKLFATYGFAINYASGKSLVIYSIGAPTENTTLKIGLQD